MRETLSAEHANWLDKVRGLDPEWCARLGVVSQPGKIGLQYRQGGETRYTKWRSLDKSSMMISPPGVSQILFNVDALESDRDTLIITEGEFDTIALAHATDLPVVSVPNGARRKMGEGEVIPSEDAAFAYLWEDSAQSTRLHPMLDRFDKIILFTDNDDPGRVLAAELAVRLGQDRCWLPDYPTKCKDANDILKLRGVSCLQDVLRDVVRLVPHKFTPITEIPLVQTELGLTSGWKDLDRHLLLTFPELVTVTGTPGAGKSQFVLAWVANLARLHGIRSAIIQLEDDPGRNRDDLERYASAWSSEIGEQTEWLARHFVVKIPPAAKEDEEAVTLDWLREALREAVLEHGCKVIVLDPWNELEHVFDKSQSETQYTNDALRELKRLARSYQVAIIVVTHPTKGITSKTIDEITMYDVAGSAAWANKSDHGLIIFREEGASQTQIKVAKCKNYRRMGFPGTVTMAFNPQNASFQMARKEAG